MSIELHTTLRRLLPLLLLVLAAAAPADDSRTELIELKGRPAEELIPLLRPVVEPGGALSGSGYRLIVHATPAQQAEIHRLLAQLDQAPRRLLITVHMGHLSRQELEEQQLHIHRQDGDASLSLASPLAGNEPGLTIDQQDAQGSGTIRHYSTRSLGEGNERQQVQAVEGRPAFIATGSERPYPSQVEMWRGPHGGSGGAVSMEYKQAASGFYAVAQLRGSQVVVRIRPQWQAFDPQDQGTVASQRIVTTVTGPLGSWLRLGGSGGDTQLKRDWTGRSISTLSLDARPMWLKVELLP